MVRLVRQQFKKGAIVFITHQDLCHQCFQYCQDPLDFVVKVEMVWLLFSYVQMTMVQNMQIQGFGNMCSKLMFNTCFFVIFKQKFWIWKYFRNEKETISVLWCTWLPYIPSRERWVLYLSGRSRSPSEMGRSMQNFNSAKFKAIENLLATFPNNRF